MALLECPECKNQVSEFAEACPKCGYPIKKMAVQKKDIFESGNTIDFTYKDEPIYKAAKVHFSSYVSLIFGILLDCFGIVLLIALVYLWGGIVLGIGIIITIVSILFMIKAKKMKEEAEKE